jgi:predicted nuclease of restriction endonuclease-like RecB superfamily
MQGVLMPLLQVRECPEDVYQKISVAAKRQNRTIAQQVIVLLQKGLGQDQSNTDRRISVLEKIKKREISADVKAIDPVVLIREDRDR